MINFETFEHNEQRQKIISTGELIKIVEAARAAEISRDKRASLKAFEPIWNDVENDPDFSRIEPPSIRAELYRIAGYFLNFYGKAESRKNCQNRAKRLITKAINLFQDLNLKEKADEAYIILAVSYWNSGDTENCEAILRQIEEDYADSPFETPYLQSKLTRAISLWAKEKYSEAFELIESLTDKMKYSTDKSLKLSFHNKVGSMYVAKGIYDKGINHFQKGIAYAYELNNHFLRGSQYNNLACVYRELALEDARYFRDAFDNIEKSLEIFENFEAPGWYAVALETRAGIFYRMGDLDQALETINRSIEMMRDGDDYLVLVEALVVRFEILCKKNDFAYAMRDFGEAVELSRRHIGDFKVELLNKKIVEMIYIKEKSNLNDQVDNFRKHIVGKALIGNNFHREKTARELGITRGGLYEILEVQYPELYTELNFKKRDWGPTSKKRLQAVKENIERTTNLKVIEEGKKSTKNYEIKKMNVAFDQMVYPGKKNSDKNKMSVFYVPQEAGEVAYDGDSVVLCQSSTEFIQGKSLIILNHNKSKTFLLALAGRNDINKSVYIQDIDTGVNLITENFKIVGKIVGCCSSFEAVSDVIVFKSFGGN